MEITYQPIGTIHSPFLEPSGMPIQPAGAKNVEGSIVILPELEPALKDIEGFSHLILLDHFHRVGAKKLQVVPFLDSQPRGVLATRSPARPNSIGLSVVKLLKREKNLLFIQGIDVLDGTPLLDLKPYVPEFDHPLVEGLGWLESQVNRVESEQADQRFS